MSGLRDVDGAGLGRTGLAGMGLAGAVLLAAMGMGGPALAQNDDRLSAPVWRQERVAARVDAQRFGGPRNYLRAADTAVQRGQWVRAVELLERAETRVLNTGIGRGLRDPDTGRRSPGGPVVASIGAARDAAADGERRAALRNIGRAMARLDDVQAMEDRARDQYDRGWQAGRADGWRGDGG